MKRVLFAGTVLAMLAACGSQTEPAEEATEAPAEAAAEATAAAPEATAAPAAAAEPNAAPANFAKGDTVEVTTQTECREVGPDADDTPWDMYPGVTKEVIAVEGSELRVAIADTECLVSADAVKLSG